MHIVNVRLLGSLHVSAGELRLTDCSIEFMSGSAPPEQGSRDRRLDGAFSERALSLTGGNAVLTQVLLRGHPTGAIAIDGGDMTLFECTIRDCRASVGGAMLVRSASSVARIIASNIANNSATVSGGAVQVR